MEKKNKQTKKETLRVWKLQVVECQRSRKNGRQLSDWEWMFPGERTSFKD